MKNISVRGLKHLWEFCLDATNTDKEAGNKFYSLALDLLIKGEVNKSVLLKFMDDNNITKSSGEKQEKKKTTRAKTVLDDGPRMPGGIDYCGRSGAPGCGASSEYEAPRRYTSRGSSPRSC